MVCELSSLIWIIFPEEVFKKSEDIIRSRISAGNSMYFPCASTPGSPSQELTGTKSRSRVYFIASLLSLVLGCGNNRLLQYKGETQKSKERGERVRFWYCAFCGRYHTVLTPRYDFHGWRKRGKAVGRDNLCNKGILFLKLLENSGRS